ncbi:MAG: protein-tyrosine-phosphatase [Acetobacteraceae bacterium]|nr:protein-tyrosine-phosphatase [Acetobacteraceae bacterium]
MDTIAPFRITVCGIEELTSFCDTQVSHVLSILDPEWPVPEAFGDFGEHEKLELRFHDVIEDTPDQIIPREEHVSALLDFGRDLMAEPREHGHLLVHCHAGISRSSAAMTLILAQGLPHVPAERIVAEVLHIREKAWPNLRIIELGDALLGRRGTLVEAAHDLYRRQVERRPFLWEVMSKANRQRELATAAKPQDNASAASAGGTV